MPTWRTRGRAPHRTRPPGGRPEPLPQKEQSALPPDYNEQLDTPGFSLGHVLETEIGRPAHPFDERRDAGAKRAAILNAILSKIGMRGQVFSNFRVDVGVTDELVLPYNPMRNYLIIVNTGTATIFAAFERNADTATGVPIVAGGNYEPILGTVSSVHLVAGTPQEAVIVEGFYTWARARG